MAARKSGADAYNNGKTLFLFFQSFLLYCQTTAMLVVVIEVYVQGFYGSYSLGPHSSHVCLIYDFVCAQDPSATLRTFPSRLMINSAVRLKWGCLLASVCQTVDLYLRTRR